MCCKSEETKTRLAAAYWPYSPRSPHVKCLPHCDIWRAGSRHLRKHGTLCLPCSIREQNTDFSCQLQRKIPICINICDIDLVNDFEVSLNR